MPSCVRRESGSTNRNSSALKPLISSFTASTTSIQLFRRDITSAPRSYLISWIRTRGSPPKSSRSLDDPRRTNSAPGSNACSFDMITLVTATSAPMVTRERRRTLRIEDRGSRIEDRGFAGEQVGFTHQAEASQGFVKVYCLPQAAVEIDHLGKDSVVEFAGRRVEGVVQPFDQGRE